MASTDMGAAASSIDASRMAISSRPSASASASASGASSGAGRVGVSLGLMGLVGIAMLVV